MLIQVPRDCCVQLGSYQIPAHVNGSSRYFTLTPVWLAHFDSFELFNDKPFSHDRDVQYRTTECEHSGIKGSISYFPHLGSPFDFVADEGWSELVYRIGSSYKKPMVIGTSFKSGINDMISYYTNFEVSSTVSDGCFVVASTRLTYYPAKVIRQTTYSYGRVVFNEKTGSARKFSVNQRMEAETQEYESSQPQFDSHVVIHPTIDLGPWLSKASSLAPSSSFTKSPYCSFDNYSIEGLRAILEKWLHIPILKGNTTEILGQLSNDFAVQLYDTQVNLLSYIKEGFELIEVIKGDITKIKSLARCNIRGKIKDLASLYLSYHYGYRLTVADTSELIGEAIDGLINPDGDRVTVHRTYHDNDMDVYFALSGVPSLKTDKISQTLESLLSNGLYGLNILWDLIPFSFVFDWFTDLISNGAETLDHRALLSTYSVKDVLVCQRVSRTVQVDKLLPPNIGLDFTGEVSPFNFVRSRRIALPLPRSTHDESVPIKHWFEGLTLIIANN